MARHESVELAACDDISAYCIGIRHNVAVLVARLRGRLNDDDRRELEQIIERTRRIQAYAAPWREEISVAYQGKATAWRSAPYHLMGLEEV